MSEVIAGDACPCCGDIALPRWCSVSRPNEQAPYGLESEARFYYECRECGLRTKDYQTQKAALKSWNTRFERTCEPVKKFSEDSPWPKLVCSECGRPLHVDDAVDENGIEYSELQPYCGCGARVVES